MGLFIWIGYAGYVVGGLLCLWGWNVSRKMSKEKFVQTLYDTADDLEQVIDGISNAEIRDSMNEVLRNYAKYTDVNYDDLVDDYQIMLDSLVDIIDDNDLADEDKVKYLKNAVDILKGDDAE